MDDERSERIGLVHQARRLGVDAKIVPVDGRPMIAMDPATFRQLLAGSVPGAGEHPGTRGPIDSDTLTATADAVVASILGGRIEILHGGRLVTTARDQIDARTQLAALRRMAQSAGLNDEYTTRAR
jgi:hypothetical protein